MFSRDRRRFLHAAGATVAASLVAQGFPAAIASALATPPDRRTGTIADVGHVVVLMQENRSFDHYFGSLRGVRGFADPRVLELGNGDPVWRQPVSAARTKFWKSRGVGDDVAWVYPFHLDTHASGDHHEGTDHGWSSGHGAWNLGRNDRWIEQKQDVLTMAYLRRDDAAFHYALADAFTVCDAYHASALADTAINRIYLWSGTSDPSGRLGTKDNGPGSEERPETNGYTWTTYPERLEKAGISWRVYQGGTGEPGSPTDNYTDNSLEFFATYQVKEGADPAGPLVRNGVSTHTLRDLRRDVLHDRLPQVTWIVAPYKYSEHPKASPADGAFYIREVIEALTANPKVWSRTVLFLNYDENDGFFDHVVPPAPPLTSGEDGEGMVSQDLAPSLPDEIVDLDRHPRIMAPVVPDSDPGGLQPIGLGNRVPMIVISPWTRGGWVCSETFDHTSVLRFLEKRFGVEEPNISAWRRSVCGDLTSAFDFSGKTDIAMPKPGVPPGSKGKTPILVPREQAMPRQEPGTRPARPLGYAWSIRHRLANGASHIAFDNSGKLGVAFLVYDGLHRETPPRRYAVSAGDRIEDRWRLAEAGDGYDRRIHGPHGYFCALRGFADDPVEAEVQGIPSQRRIRLVLNNRGPKDITCRIANAYGDEPVRHIDIPAHGGEEVLVDLAGSAGWYDVTVTTPDAPRYLRRFAGHHEDGKPSTSDPGVSPRSS
ncbi:phosphocholine-specific phospholipase C [Luteibacter yeojuensis]|uniref:phospholipase C n=1 Tax=Luteibacter yeojuensis TaxID=345309 RepID=A0A7X5QRR9_9GAMM|nr:phospholipase C, phosphocholine-specific [Luteibacter yeojuensis]NID14160.1 phospholipase C, phosphocholine-specific [Luteibacter yeojuensis]